MSVKGDKLNSVAIENQLNNKKLKVCVFQEIDSTNNEAKRLGNYETKAPVVIVADRQTDGRGRMGRSFYSPSGTGVYFSYLYRSKGSLDSNVIVTSAAAVAVCRAILEVCGIETQIKWVNDIYLGDKKVCGILTEAVTELTGEMAQCVIVGIGINVTTEQFPDDLTLKAGCLGDKGVDRNLLVAAVINHLENLIDGLANHSFIDEYRKRSCVLGKTITYVKNNETKTAQAMMICDDGSLLVRHDDGTEAVLNTGEISVKM